MALEPAITDIEKLRDHPALATLLGWRTDSVEGVKWDRNELAIVVQRESLREAAREIERVYGTPVTISDSALARETITASFTDRPVQEVVNVVCSVLSAHCAVQGGRVRIDR